MLKQKLETIGASPFGMRFKGKIIEAERGHLSVSFYVNDDLSNLGNIMHGGAIAAIVDEVLGMTSYTLEREGFFVAINLNIDFLKPIQIDSTIITICDIINEGKSIAHAECKIYDEKNQLMAKASGNLKLVKNKD